MLAQEINCTYMNIQGHTRPDRPYGTLQGHTGQPDHTGPYRIIWGNNSLWGLTGPYWTLKDHMEPDGLNRTICDHPGPYRTIKY